MPVAPLPVGALLAPEYLTKKCRYEVVRVLAEGGMGIAYVAKDRLLGPERVIKEAACGDIAHRESATHDVLPLPHGGARAAELHQELTRQFLREAKVLLALQHPRIVRVLDVFEQHGTAYYVMNLIDGVECLSVRAPGPIPWPRAQRILEQLLDALEAAHGAGVAHFDLKPLNVLATADDDLTLIDFGSARLLGRTMAMVQPFTPGYAPLELLDSGQDPDERADLYSWGMIAYGLSRTHPGSDGDPLGAMSRAAAAFHGQDPYASAEGDMAAAGVPAGWAKTVASCLSLDRNGRPASVVELRRELAASEVCAASNVGKSAMPGLPPQPALTPKHSDGADPSMRVAHVVDPPGSIPTIDKERLRWAAMANRVGRLRSAAKWLLLGLPSWSFGILALWFNPEPNGLREWIMALVFVPVVGVVLTPVAIVLGFGWSYPIAEIFGRRRAPWVAVGGALLLAGCSMGAITIFLLLDRHSDRPDEMLILLGYPSCFYTLLGIILWFSWHLMAPRRVALTAVVSDLYKHTDDSLYKVTLVVMIPLLAIVGTTLFWQLVVMLLCFAPLVVFVCGIAPIFMTSEFLVGLRLSGPKAAFAAWLIVLATWHYLGWQVTSPGQLRWLLLVTGVLGVALTPRAIRAVQSFHEDL